MQAKSYRLKGDPLPWLLEPDNPAVRYWTLVDLCGRTDGDSEVREARAAILQSRLVQDIFALQNPEGHWGDASKPHSALGAGGALGLLHMLGVPPDERTRLGCESFMKNS